MDRENRIGQEQRTGDLLRHLANKPGHDEVKAAFQQLLIEEFQVELGALEFERRVPEVRGRLDALIGRTILEAKRDLAKEWPDVARRMPDYLADREREEGEKFVGIATDGLRWAVFERDGGKVVKVKETTLDPDKPNVFLAWLDGAVALKSSLPPDPLTVRAELGQDSLAFRRAYAKLGDVWAKVSSDPSVILKRQLWAQLLKLVYGREVENDALWFQHTFLVIVAKAIAHAVLGMNEDDPKRLLAGATFRDTGIHGAVESDFFDWIVADPEGEDLVRRIATHARRFRLREAQCDVLKVLYESLIDRDERHGLGEYYTPDWLAAKVVRHIVRNPVEERVLDPACGSGTFLFHAIRLFLAEAKAAGMKPAERVRELTGYVAGIDIHPVAVIIARVTYLLGIGPDLDARGGSISLPVYLGDAMQLNVRQLMGAKELTVGVPPLPPEHGPATLKFPDVFCRDAVLFDQVIEVIRAASEENMRRLPFQKRLTEVVHRHNQRKLDPEEEAGVVLMAETFDVYHELRIAGRDSIWSYVARNLSRPLVYSAGDGRINVLVGNPPWVAYRNMSDDLKTKFKELAGERHEGERVYVGGKLATQNDLSALFVARSVGLYLRAGGRLAFVMPLAALSRGQFEKFRSGDFGNAKVAFDEAWTMDDGVQPLFPVPSCALFGRRRGAPKRTPAMVRAYSGALPYRDVGEQIADKELAVIESAPAPSKALFEGGSVYRDMFRQGATLVPRMLCLVEPTPPTRLGVNRAAPLVQSRKSSQEKAPWRTMDKVKAPVDAQFLRPILLGESVLPYRVFRSFEGVIPVDDDNQVLDREAAADRIHWGLPQWMKEAEKIWNENAESNMTLIERWNYQNGLGAQFPIAPLRVVYAASGTNPAACLVRDQRAVIEHVLYWSAVETETEGYYLSAILNSETTRSRGEHLQARGQFGARHFDKVMFTLPIPRFNLRAKLHNQLADAAREAETVAAAVALPEAVKFQRARKIVRDALAEAGVSQKIDALVTKLLEG